MCCSDCSDKMNPLAARNVSFHVVRMLRASLLLVKVLCTVYLTSSRESGDGRSPGNVISDVLSPDHAPRGAFFTSGPGHARDRSILLDRCEATRCATRLGLI